MGEYLRTRTCLEFYRIITSIVKMAKQSKDADKIYHLINCCAWQIKASDHEFFIRTGLLDLLLEGNSNPNGHENPIKYQWEKINIGYKEGKNNPQLSDSIYSTVKFLTLSGFGMLLSENKEHVSLNSSKSQDSAHNTLQKAFSNINSEVTAVLLNNTLQIIFEKIDIFVNQYESFEPVDWNIYLKFRDDDKFSDSFKSPSTFLNKKNDKKIKVKGEKV